MPLDLYGYDDEEPPDPVTKTELAHDILAARGARITPFTTQALISAIEKSKGSDMPFNLGNFFGTLGTNLGGDGSKGGPIGGVLRAVGSGLSDPVQVVAPSVAPVPAMAGFLPGGPAAQTIGGAIGGAVGSAVLNRITPGGNTSPVSRRELDFGAIGIPEDGTAAQKRAWLVKRASENLGSRITARDIVAMTRKVGVDKTGEVLGLEALAVCFIIVNQPKRRRRGITARDITNARAFGRRLATANRAARKICTTARARR